MIMMETYRAKHIFIILTHSYPMYTRSLYGTTHLVLCCQCLVFDEVWKHVYSPFELILQNFYCRFLLSRGGREFILYRIGYHTENKIGFPINFFFDFSYFYTAGSHKTMNCDLFQCSWSETVFFSLFFVLWCGFVSTVILLCVIAVTDKKNKC